jgi:hypothetical protein
METARSNLLVGLAMAEFDPANANTLLAVRNDTLWPNQADQDAYVKEAMSRLRGRNVEDRKEATKLAVETAKLLVTIAVAVLVATGTLFQFARTNGLPWDNPTIILFAVVVPVLFLSMAAGLTAISRAYKNADGRESISGPPWSTAALANPLNLQSGTGAVALVLLIAGLSVWALDGKSVVAAISVSIPSGPQSSLPAGPLTIEGTWTELRLRTASHQEIKLPPNSSPITLICK